MSITATETSAGAAAGMLRGDHGPRALILLIVGVLSLAAGLLVLAVDRIQTTMLERDAIAEGLRWTNGLLESLETVDTVFQGGELSARDRRTIELASRLGGLQAFLIFDRDGRVIAASDPSEIGRVNVSGYWASEVLRGSPHAALEAVAPADGGDAGVVAETYVPVHARGAAGGRVIGAFEAYLDVSDSARSYRRIGLFASVAGALLIAVAGAIAVAFVRRTMSFRLERERMLAAARRAAEASSAAKSRFLATVSHEIRTPMNGVLATAELLEATPLVADQRDMVSVIRRSGGALLELLNQILDQSKIEAGKLELVSAPFGLSELLQAAADCVGPLARSKDLSLSVTVSEALPETVVGDEARLRQVLLNLLGNAVKFTAHGAVTVAAEPSGEGRETVAIRVADTGIGIAEEAMARLFRPFEQADASTTRRFGGTGLGLTIARELAELMGGTLGVASTPGRGSEFTLVVPLPAAVAAARPAVPAAGRPALDLDVLVADDDPTNRWVIGRQLDRLGCRAVVVEDGAAALRAWAAEPDRWQVLVTDWHMPGLDGLGLLEALHGEPAFARRRPMLVMMTASGLPEEIERALRAGADHVLVKPVALDRLATVLSGADRPAATPEPADDAGAILDTGELEALCGGDAAMLADVLARFQTRLAEGVDELAATGDARRRRAVAHALRGAAAAVGARSLAAACAGLEAASGDGTAERAAVAREVARLREVLRERMHREDAAP
ncbi:MAG: ATP-binding protein [Thalassobaculum sp.]|uniref:hybrid sensor histidine kinase/response regulator n=1 Tax=Thalassobaculum sp. TaxID=2022740 RepID=UPI0032EB43D1